MHRDGLTELLRDKIRDYSGEDAVDLVPKCTLDDVVLVPSLYGYESVTWYRQTHRVLLQNFLERFRGRPDVNWIPGAQGLDEPVCSRTGDAFGVLSSKKSYLHRDLQRNGYLVADPAWNGSGWVLLGRDVHPVLVYLKDSPASPSLH